MTPVKIIALVFIVFAVVKLLVISIDPASWKSVVRAMYIKPAYTMALSVILGFVILSFLLQEMTIIHVFAAMTFMMTLMMIQFAAMGDKVIEITELFFDDKNLIKKFWFPILIWILLMGWVLYEIFV